MLIVLCLQEGRPFCKCPEGLVPDPSPEVQCSIRDPCDPSPCGPGTTCTANSQGNPICRCLPGLVPKPDTITGEHLYFTLSWFWVFNGCCKCRVEPEGGRMPPKPSSDQMQENYEPVILPRKVMPGQNDTSQLQTSLKYSKVYLIVFFLCNKQHQFPCR